MHAVASARSSIRRHPGRWGIAGVTLAGLMAFGLWWFAPWNLIVDRRVDEALPSSAATPAGQELGDAATSGARSETGPVDGGEADPAGARPVTLARGSFIDLEHATSGRALLIELEDRTRFLRLEDLDTSNGPDLRVVLTDRPLSEDWHVWDDGELVDLGPLKGNIGSSNYRIPDGVDLSGLRTAVIWCRRFSVGFGVAPLDA